MKSARELLSPLGRIALKAEEDFKKANQKLLPNSFEVVVYTDFDTEAPPTPSEDDEGKFFCRARSLAGHHDSMENPEDIRNPQKRRAVINSFFQAMISLNNPDIGKIASGSVWNCTLLGERIVQLNYVTDVRNVYFIDEDGEKTPIEAEMNAGGKALVGSITTPTAPSGLPPLADNLTSEVTNVEGVKIKLTFKTETVRKSVESKKYYVDFLNTLVEKMKATNYSHGYIKVNSAVRTPSEQAYAMVHNRFNKGMDYFRKWVNKTYGDDKATRELKPIIEKQWTSERALINALTQKIEEQVKRRVYISNHLKSTALDFHTNSLSFNDASLLLATLMSMRPAHVKFVNWEHVESGELQAKRYKDGAIDNEHIHLNLATGGKGE